MAEKENMQLRGILAEHAARYPLMEPCDAVKLVYQNEFGGGHLIADAQKALERLREEFETVEYAPRNPLFESIGNGLVRVRLDGVNQEKYPADALCGDFVRSAQLHRGSREVFLEKLQVVKELAERGVFRFSTEELERYLADYAAAGCPAVSHSETYRRAYHPAYRVVRKEELSCPPAECAAAEIAEAVLRLSGRGERVLAAVDGRCASGKTTVAARLADLLECPVVHMDDFFLRPEQRTAQRYAEPGGNVDRERFLEEVLLPLRRGARAVYRPFDCGTQRLKEPVELPDAPVVLVEGSYSCHPDLAAHYDLNVFLTVEPEEQMARIRVREGEEYAEVFRERWIPLEERYFSAFRVEERCDMTFDMTGKR